MSSESSSTSAAESSAGYWAVQEEVAARLEAMTARARGEDELSAATAAEGGAGYWAGQEEAAARLEAMASRARGEDDLSEEQLQTNNQLQEDEVLALQAIYGDDMVMLENKAGLRFIQIFVHYPCPGGIRVFLNLRPNGTMVRTDNNENQDGGELLYACSLQHLPPVVLTCLLPRSYPSTCPPYFTISAKWLDEPKVSYLCAALDDVWTELPGQEIVYRWVDWLNSSSLSCIAWNDNIILDPDKTSNSGDERAIVRRLLVDSTIPLMHSYNEKRSHEIFLQSLYECGICLSENAGRNFIKLPCHHSFCVKCMESHCRIHVKEGNLAKLTCPDTTCHSPLPPSTLRSLLREDGYARWESFALQKLLDAMPDLVYCPRCGAACLEVDNDAQCPECFFTFCSLCKGRRHVGNTCVTPAERIHILKERQKLYSLPPEQLLREQREIDELTSLQEVLRDAKQCPCCKMAISKIEGCNKMTCGNCGRFFCYRCNEAIKGYGHFWNGNCVLFETRHQAQYPPWQDDEDSDEDSEEDAEQIELEWVRVHTYPCPNCGRLHEKLGTNNHILCTGCRGHYCALCRKRVVKSSEHFGPRGCQQHTEDPW